MFSDLICKKREGGVLNFKKIFTFKFFIMSDDCTCLPGTILNSFSPAGIHLKENRALVTERIEK